MTGRRLDPAATTRPSTRLSRHRAGVTVVRLLAAALVALLMLPALGLPASGAPVLVRPGGLVSPTGQAERIIVVRPNRIDLFRGPRAWWVPRVPGELSLPALARLVPEDFLKSEPDGLFRLRAALVQSRDTQLIAAAPEVKTLLLDSAGTDGASLQGSGAQLTLSATKVQAVTPGTVAGAEPAPTRGFMAYRGSSRVLITDTQLDNLGASVLDVEGRATGLAITSGSSLVLTRSRVSWGFRGITVNQSTLEAAAVTVRGAQHDGIDLQRGSRGTLSQVTVEGSGRVGLMLRPTSALVQKGPITLLENKFYGLVAGAPAGLVINGLTAARNGLPESVDGGGISLSDCNSCTLTDVTLHANHGEGLSVTGKLVQLRDVVARHNDGDGLKITGCTECWITEVTANMNGRVGVLVRESRDVTIVEALTDGNDTTGIVVRGCTACLVRDLTVRGGRFGVQVGGRSGRVTVGPGTIEGSQTGIDVGALSDDVLLGWLTVTDSTTKGLQLEGRNTVVKATSVEQQGGTAVSSVAPGLQVSDSRFLGADRGLYLSASASVSRVAIRAARQGVTVDGPSRVDLKASDIAVTTDRGAGLRAVPGATMTVSQTRVSADQVLSGDISQGDGNDLPFDPDWLGLFMVLVVCAAFGLELTRRFRESAVDRIVPAPDHVLNIH